MTESRPRTLSRTFVAVGLLVVGSLVSLILLLVGADPGLVLVPFSLAAIGALAILPFPLADYGLALGLLGTMPVLPPSGLPNLPLAAAVVALALIRVLAQRGAWPTMRAAALVVGVWALVAAGALISDWPPVGIWLRPASVLIVGFGASLLGLLVWRDPERLRRWLTGLTAGTLVVSVSALIVFGLQYVVPALSILDAVVASQGYLRGDAAATAFEAVNNWRLGRGEETVLRAVSPFFPSPKGLGAFLGIGLPVAAALALNRIASRRVQVMALLAVATSVTVLIVTYSRSSWVAAAVALVAVVAVALVARWRASVGLRPARATVVRLGMAVSIGALVGLGGVLTTLNDRALERIAEASEDQAVLERIEGDSSAVERIQAGLLRGTGLGNWTGTAVSDPPAPGEHVRYVHNLYLEYAGATGLLGGLWVVLLFGVTIGGGMRGAISGQSAATTLPGLALVAIGAFGATQGLFDDSFLNPQIAWLLAWAFGGGAAFLVALPVARANATANAAAEASESGASERGAVAGS